NIIDISLGALASGNFSLGVNAINACATGSIRSTNFTVNPLPVISASSGTTCAGGSFTIIPSGASTYTFSGGSNVVSPSTSTNYNVTGTSSLGCPASNTAVSNITVSALPNVTANVSSPAICNGNTTTLFGSGANSYTW